MSLKAVLDLLDGVEDAVRGFYTEAEDGKDYLTVDNVDALPSVRGLTNTLRRLREGAPDASRLKALLDRLAELEAYADLELSADEIRERLQERAELKAAAAEAGSEQIDKLRETYEKRVNATRKQLEEQIAAKDAEIQELRGFVERLTIDNEIEAALAKVNVIPETREAVKALLKLRGPRDVQDGESYRDGFETDLGESRITE